MNEEMAAEQLWVLVEGPGPGEAEFLGRWLLAAVEADRALQEQFKQNPDLKELMSRLELCWLIPFSLLAMDFVELLMTNRICFGLALCDSGEAFSVMAQIGFFRLTGDRYQMTIPQEVSGSRIEAALLRLAATEDEESFLHPEHLVTCLSEADAKTWKHRLERLPWMQRVADRALLLGEL
jgi:hypothetical protein